MIKKIGVSIFFISLLLAIPPTFQVEPVFAENSIRQIIRIAENYPANVASVDYPIDPPLENLDRSFLFYTVSHVSENDASDTFKIVKILDKNTVRVIGEDTATGNNAIDIIIIIIEFDSGSEIKVQHIQESLSAVAGSQDFIMGSVNTTNSFIINRGMAINGSFTSIGNNDFNRLRILNSTAWEVNIDTAPNTPQGLAVSIVDMNSSDISTQTGLHTLTGTSATLTGGVDFTAIDPTRTMLLVTYTTNGGSALEPERMMLQASLTTGGDITFSRFIGTGSLFISWTLIEFPADLVKVTHFDTQLNDIVSLVDVTVPDIKDLSNVFAMSHVTSPFGASTGKNDESSPSGSIDKGQAIFSVRSNTVVGVQRDDNDEISVFGWQLVEFLEKDNAENAQGTNNLRQIVKIEDVYLASSSVNQFFTISPPLLNISKAVLFMSTSNDYSNLADVSERIKRYEIFNTTTLRITGSNDPALSNLAMPFSATIVEFDSLSPIQVQRDQVQYSADSSNDARFLEGEFFLHSSPKNLTGSSIMFNGWSGSQGGSAPGDTTYGAEEVIKVRIVNETRWGYELDNPIDFQEVVGVVNLIDWGNDDTLVQRGEASIVGTSLSVSPITDVIQNQTLLFVTIRSTNNEFDNEPDHLAVLSTLDSSSPPNIIFEKFTATETVDISWELISFPLRTLFVQHGIHNQTAGVSNSTSTIPRAVDNVTQAFVIGTTWIQNGYSGGKGSFSTSDVFGEVTGVMTLDDTTTARFERDVSVGSWDVGFQVVEFQGNFSAVAVETVGGEIETNQTTGDPIPACCSDGPAPDPVASYTAEEIAVLHQLLEWFEPSNAALEGMINDIENNGLALFEIILRMHNGTYGVDANLTNSAEFYQDKYLTVANLTDFINQIEPDVRTEFGDPP